MRKTKEKREYERKKEIYVKKERKKERMKNISTN